MTSRKKKEANDRIKLNSGQLKEKNEDLVKMTIELEAFAYVSSHDLQELLRKIQTFAGLLLEKENRNLSANGITYFRFMQDSAQRMQILIQDLLDFSRVNNTERKLVKTDLGLIVEEVKAELRETIQDKHATVEVLELCPANIIVFQFRQLMLNLIGNALKFSNPAIPPHIVIKCSIIKGSKLKTKILSPKKDYCHISVTDNGIGFEKEFSEKIFEVFQKLHSKEEYAGTGIGLAIVKKIVDNYNGIITATSKYKKGATFDIYIPAS